MKHRLWRYLLAILLGNAIFFSLQHYLPERFRHQAFTVDWGLAVDLALCAACFGVIRLIR
jgi:hypothetical protein